MLIYRTLIFFLALGLAGCAMRLSEAERDFTRGNRFLGEGLPQMAIQSYQRSLSVDSEQPEVWFNLGVAHLRLDQPEAGANAFRRSLKLKPSPRAWYNLGYAELKADRPAEAAEALGRSVSLEPNRSSGWNNLAISYRRLKRYRLAEEASRKALSIDPNNPELLNNMAWLYLVWGEAGTVRRVKALQLAKQANERTRGNNARVLATLAEASFRNKDREAAIRAIKRALLLEPKNHRFLESLATYKGKKTPK